jgi:hypothetical protein
MCKSCGYKEPYVEEYKEKKHRGMTDEQLSKELYKRVRSVNTRKQSEREIRQMIEDYIKDNNIKFEMTVVEGNRNNEEENENE